MGNKKRGKRGVSPVVSTILLIMIVIILAIIILLWSVGFVKEVYTKEVDGKEQSVDNICKILTIDAIINNDGSFGIRNSGNVPIYKIKLKVTAKDSGDSTIGEVMDQDGHSVSLGPGQSAIISQPGENYGDYEEVKVIPILLAKKQGGGDTPEEVPCPESNAKII